ncbi:MAG: MATE family efflux transporter [Burkholderiales bacterium]|nr:MATE family efflux transporter [Burkholderiales bacterium]
MSTANSAAPAGRNPLLTGAVLPTLLKLAAPNVMAMTTAVLVGIAETYYIGTLGTAPLAAMAVVFPFNMLTQMMSNGAMGGGVSSSVSRALGAGSIERAAESAAHAAVIGLVAGLVYSLLLLLFGPALYALLGARGDVLALATGYATVLFSGAWLIWLFSTLSSILRGTGNMAVPSATILITSFLQIVLGGALGLGLAGLPRLGMPGVAIGQLIAQAAGVAFLLWYLMGGRSRVRLRLAGVAYRRERFIDILRVGALACLSPVQSVLTVMIFTGLVARLGVEALAGYGIGQRLEFLLIPIAFGIGVAAVPMVGMAVGAGNIARARRVAWTAGAVSALNLGVVGAIVALSPTLWSRFFSDDPGVLREAASYLVWAGPAFGFFGFGLTLYFASQGAGKVLGPVLAATLRLMLVALVGTWLAGHGAPAAHYFALVGAAMFIYGLSTMAAVYFTPWGPQTSGAPRPRAA